MTTSRAPAATPPDLSQVSSAVKVAPFPTLALDGAMHIVAANLPLTELTGWQPEELCGRRVGELLAWWGADRAGLNRARGRPVSVAIATSVLDGGWRVVTVVPLGPEAPDAQDHVRRLSAQHDFIAMVSHELRTPVAAVLGFAELLTRPAALAPDDHADVLEGLVRNARRQVRIIDQLLDASALAEGTIEVVCGCVPVADIVSRAVAEVPPLDGSVVLDLPPGLRVTADAFRLQQVLVSFLSNAVKYGGPHVVVSAEVSDGEVHLLVSDDGPGVPEAFRPDLFEMFTQAGHPIRRTARGTGLGLHLARGMAVAMGGTVTFAPREPSGAVFGVRLPAC